MKCTVKFKFNQLACPGTLHLPDRNPVYVSICLFGRYHRTQHVYPSFPMIFNSKMKFHRIFTNAKTPEQVLEILEDEIILIELRQHAKGNKGGHVLAVFEESTRKFLYPSPSFIPCHDQLKRDILLLRTERFSNDRGLDPQLTFRTKTYIEEAPSILLSTPHGGGSSVSKQLPLKSCSVSTYMRNEPIGTSHANTSFKRNKHTKKKNRSLPVSTQLDFDSSSSPDELESTKSNSRRSVNKHCICDCPTLHDEEFNLHEWMQLLSIKQNFEPNKVKPFRTGKAPDSLMSKREFASSSKIELKTFKEGLCKYCMVPSRKCVLCNAYKTVYGEQSFLIHRFERYHRDITTVRTSGNLKPRNCSPTRYHIDNSYVCPSHRPKQNYIDRHSPAVVKTSIHTPGFEVKNESNSDKLVNGYQKKDESSSDDDEDWWKNRARSSYSVPKARPRPLSSEAVSSSDDVIGRPVTSPRLPSRIFNLNKEYSRYEDSKEESYRVESDRIHRRIKELMKKNNSVLQYDLSSSESITDEDEDGINTAVKPSFLDLRTPAHMSRTTPSFARKSLSRSVVVPLGSGNYWSSDSMKVNSKSHRDVLDSSLKAIYQNLYEETLKSK